MKKEKVITLFSFIFPIIIAMIISSDLNAQLTSRTRRLSMVSTEKKYDQELKKKNISASMSVLSRATITQENLDKFILDTMNAYHIPGMAVALIKNGKIVFTKGYGFADIEKNIPFTPNTINAEIASISKTVTATALMKLWEQGLFGLDDPINNYLSFPVTNPFFPNVPITFRMLLDHTASINEEDHDGFFAQLFVAPGTSEPLEEFVPNLFVPGGTHYVDSAIFYHYAPGTQYNYSSFGYTLIGYLVQHISGMPFSQYCHQNIFEPLCMNNTGWYFSEIDSNIASHPYYYDEESGNWVDYGFYEYADLSDGQLKTTVVDLSKFLLMNMNNGNLDGTRILDSATVSLMRSIQVIIEDSIVYDDGTAFKIGYGLGWNYLKNFSINKAYWGHFGGDMGICTDMWNNITDSTGIIMFTNSDRSLDDLFFTLFDNIADTINTASLPLLNCSYISTPCEHGHTFWKNNPDKWPASSVPMKLGTHYFYSKQQLLNLLNKPVNGNASIILSKQLIAAKLNTAQGSELSPIITTINNTNDLIGNRHFPIHPAVSFYSAQGIQMLELIATLDLYNHRHLNTANCSGNASRESNEEEESDKIIPDKRSTYSIFPNPSSQFTSISFTIEQPQKVLIQVFDIHGQFIKTLADKNFETGGHTIRWDFGNISAGVYFVKIQSAAFSNSYKVIIIK